MASVFLAVGKLCCHFSYLFQNEIFETIAVNELFSDYCITTPKNVQKEIYLEKK